MRKKDEIVERRAKILELLSDESKESWTYEELMKELNVEKRTIQGDIKVLNSDKYECDIPKHKKNVGFVISEEKKKELKEKLPFIKYSKYKNVESLDVDAMVIVYLIQQNKHPISLDDLTMRYMKYNDENIEYIVDHPKVKQEYDNQKAEIKKKLEKLVEDCVILYSKEKDSISVTKNAPQLINLDGDDIERYLYAIRAYGSVYPLRDILLNVEEKLNPYISEDMFSDSTEYIIVGNRINNNPHVIEKLQVLSVIPYDRYAIKINLKGKPIWILAGLVVYAVDKDKLYLIGKVKKEKYRIIDIEDISGEIEVDEKRPNNLFQSEEYIQLSRDMFSVSAEPKEHVVVEVKDFGSLRRKFETLCYHRNNAVIKEKDSETFIYEDDIRGMSDFSKYLRRYGRSVKVIAPESLKKMMLDDITRMEKRYREEGLYE